MEDVHGWKLIMGGMEYRDSGEESFDNVDNVVPLLLDF